MRLMILALAFTASWATAQALEDVIYKKDGSVLRGTLIEQDFENGRYKIQLKGGSVFAISKDEITKIGKEAPLNSTADNSGAININIDNSPTITQAPTQTLQQSPTLQTYGYTGDQEEKRHSIRIGRMSKDYTDSDDNGVSFSGVNIAYQYNFDENIAFYAEHNNADFDSVVIEGEYYEDYGNQLDDLSMRGTEASVMFSTNNYQGWQFYAGAGLFNEKYNFQGESDTASGTVFTLGMGYSWSELQVQLRVSGHDSSDYDDDYSSSNFALQLGYNY